jgi:hypothetical protein
MPDTDASVEGGEALNEEAGDESPRDDVEELRAEEESAKAMEAEVPHPAGYPDPGQEKPA